MSGGAVLAFGAGLTAVLGAWEALAAVERTRVAAALERMGEPLVRAGREGQQPTAAERRRLAVLAAASLLAGGWLLAGPLAGAIAAVSGPGLVLAVIGARRRRYREELGGAAAGCARALADALGAGHAISGAIAQVAPSFRGPAGRELRAAAAALGLGRPAGAVLEGLRRRAGHPGWDAIVAAMLLHRHAGGDLAGLLRDLAGSLEAAERSEREARAITAQARFTAWLVAGLPAGAALLTEAASPGFAASLVRHPISVWLVACAALLQAIALLCVRRLARPERRT